MTDSSKATTNIRIIQQQRELLYWEESTIRQSLYDTLLSTLQHLFFSSSLDITVQLSSELLSDHRLFAFLEFEELQRNVTIADVESMEFTTTIDVASRIGVLQLDECETRQTVFNETILAKQHPSTILELHHQFLCECYGTDLHQLRSARDEKLKEQQCIVLLEEESSSRNTLLQFEHTTWTINLLFISFAEPKQRLTISLDQQDARDNRWTCPICAVLRPAKNSMLAEVNSANPIRGEDMLQMHLLHHDADVTRRRTIRNATLKEEFNNRMHLAFSAFSQLIVMNYEYRRGILLTAEEQTRYRKFEDPAAWRAGIRAAIEATRRRQISERGTIEYRELMKRVEIEEESERIIHEEIVFGMEVLDPNGDFLLQRPSASSSSNENENEKDENNNNNNKDENHEHDQETNTNNSSYLSLMDDYGDTITEPSSILEKNARKKKSSSSSLYSIICRNNIDTIWKLFEERLANQRPLAEAHRVLSPDEAIAELLPQLPIEASHVRRRMGADEAVADTDRFMFGRNAPPLTKNSSNKKNNMYSPSQSPREGGFSFAGDVFGPSVDKLFSHFDHHDHEHEKHHHSPENDENDYYNDPYFNLGADGDDLDNDDFIFDDDDDDFDDDALLNDLFLYGGGGQTKNRKGRMMKRKRILRINNNSNNDDDSNIVEDDYDDDDDDQVSVDSNELFELELELDELQRKEIGARRVLTDLEWHRRVMMEKRLSVLPVAKLSIPQHERNMMALMKLEPFHRSRIIREAWGAMERLHVAVREGIERAMKEDKRNQRVKVMKPRPPFRGGGRAIFVPSRSSSASTPAAGVPQIKNKPQNRDGDGGEKQQKEEESTINNKNLHQHQQRPLSYQGFPADRLMTSLLRLETQLQSLFSSVAERRGDLLSKYQVIESERISALSESNPVDAPSWTSSDENTNYHHYSSSSMMYSTSDNTYHRKTTTSTFRPPKRPLSSSSSARHHNSHNASRRRFDTRPTSARR